MVRGQLIAGLVAILAMHAAHPVHGIRCYTCKNAHSNADCSQPEHLKQCDDTLGQDVCQTFVEAVGTPDERITKECALGPCSLDKNQNNALNLGCTGTSCNECCSTDGCNISAAPRPLPATLLPLLLASVAAVGVVAFQC